MRVFVASASGAIGVRLVPQLIERRHEVLGTHRSPRGAERLGPSRSTSTCLTGTRSWRRWSSRRPDATVHHATALADLCDLRHFDRTFGHTNLLRTRGTDALIATAQAVGFTRFVAQSYASARYPHSGGW